MGPKLGLENIPHPIKGVAKAHRASYTPCVPSRPLDVDEGPWKVAGSSIQENLRPIQGGRRVTQRSEREKADFIAKRGASNVSSRGQSADGGQEKALPNAPTAAAEQPQYPVMASSICLKGSPAHEKPRIDPSEE